jgi:hypothetical protein
VPAFFNGNIGRCRWKLQINPGCDKIGQPVLGVLTLLYVLTGQDDFSREKSLEEIKRGISDPAILAANTRSTGAF